MGNCVEITFQKCINYLTAELHCWKRIIVFMCANWVKPSNSKSCQPISWKNGDGQLCGNYVIYNFIYWQINIFVCVIIRQTTNNPKPPEKTSLQALHLTININSFPSFFNELPMWSLHLRCLLSLSLNLIDFIFEAYKTRSNQKDDDKSKALEGIRKALSDMHANVIVSQYCCVPQFHSSTTQYSFNKSSWSCFEKYW